MRGDSSFRPAWWLPGPHLQTLGARFLRSGIRVPLVRERWELPDGDFLDLDFPFPEPGGEPSPPDVLLLHGLEGSARSGYALEIYRLLCRRGIRAVGLNFRSCSGESNRLPRLYHSGETGDLTWVLARLQERFPDRTLGAIGVSLGANVLLKHLGETGDRAVIAAAATISPPFDLSAGADHLLRPAGRLYTRHLLGKLRAKLLAKADDMPPGVDLPRAMKARGFREFDDAATAPLHGFSGADDYYRSSSCAPFLDRIRVPTLLIHSADDPFLPPDRIPRASVAANPCLSSHFTARGGHVGFVTGGSPLRPVFWAEGEATAFIASHRSNSDRV